MTTDPTPPPDDENPLPPGREVAVPIEEIVLNATLLSLLMLLVPMVMYVAVWGWRDLFAGFNGFAFIGILIALVLAHEGFHAIGWKYAGGLRWRDLTFGFKWEALAPYCHAKVPMPARAYRFGAVLPGITTGILPFVVALVIGNGMWALAGAVLISGAVGDVYVLWIMRDIPPDALMLDHPEKAGGIVLEE